MGILELLFVISAKPVVVSFAILGALLVMVGPKISGDDRDNTEKNSAFNYFKGGPKKLSKTCTGLGYVLTGVSIFLFIVAGFISDLK